MTERLIQKIEHIRSLPEHIRLRYAFGAVAICMVFVIGVWLLTLKQGFHRISPEVSKGKEQAEETISNIPDTLPVTDSLRSLKESSESLRLNGNGGDADEFLNQELQRKETDTGNTDQQ